MHLQSVGRCTNALKLFPRYFSYRPEIVLKRFNTWNIEMSKIHSCLFNPFLLGLHTAQNDAFTRPCAGPPTVTFRFFAFLVWNRRSIFSMEVLNLFCGVCLEAMHHSRELGVGERRGKATLSWDFWLVIQVCESPVSEVGVDLLVMSKIKITTEQVSMGLYFKSAHWRGCVM